MTIETKYNIGDEVSYRPINPVLSHAINGIIRYINIEVFPNRDSIVQYIMDNGEWVTEDRILPK